jgi:glycosyltransferase involved in cell wall biosynthesis
LNKILIIENSLYLTGGLNAILSSSDRLREVYDFHFIIPKKSSVKPIIQAKGYTVTELPFLEISKSFSVFFYLPRLYKNAKSVLQYMRDNGISILHVNDMFNMIGCMVKRLDPSIKLVNHARLLRTSYIGPIYPFFVKQLKKFADVIICVSEAVKKDIGPDSKTLVIYDVPALTNKYGDWKGLQVPHSLKILYLGNYIKGKGQEHGLKAFIELQKSFTNTSICFTGSVKGPAAEKFKKELIDMAEKAGVLSKVTFEEKSTDVEKKMKDHDVVLNLSESESFSFVCLESILYGVPLIAANSGGPAEITRNGEIAFLIENKDFISAANALKYIIEHASEVKEKASKAKQWAEQKFHSENAKRQLQDKYNSLA